MSDAQQLDQAFEDKATKMAVFAYIARAVNLCVDKELVSVANRTKVSISQQGLRMLGTLNFTEKELREGFLRMSDAGYVSNVLDYDDIFNGVISKGETLH